MSESRGQYAWVSPKVIARRLSISVDMVYKLIKSGQLEAIRIGSEYRISEEAYEMFIERSRLRTS